MKKVTDIDGARTKRQHERQLGELQELSQREAPWLTVELFGHEEHSPMRITADVEGADQLYQAAQRLMNAAYSVLSNAYTADPDPEKLPRLVMTLFHSGKIRAHTLFGPGPGGTFIEADWEWVDRCFPHFREAVDSARANHDAKKGTPR